MLRKILEKIDNEMANFENSHEKNMEDTDYAEFFKQKLKEWGVKSPAELDKAKRKKFFSEIKKEWK